MSDAPRTLDLRGLRCPLPALKTLRRLRDSAPGATLAILADDPLAALDVPNAIREAGAALLESERLERGWRFVARAGATAAAEPLETPPPAD